MTTNFVSQIKWMHQRNTQNIKLTQKEIENLNRPITIKEIESLIKKLQQRKVQDHMALW